MEKLVHIFLILVCGILFVNGRYELNDYKNHPCIRKCGINTRMTCEYNFTIEYYYTLSKACYDCPLNKTDCDRPHCVAADGTLRGLLTVNRMIPGPGIHVCHNDTIVVNVHNKLEGSEGTSIHWHGVHQRGSQHMDGVSMITQCPIPAHSSFQYKFLASTPGTHFWHAHSGLQRSDGLFGHLVIRDPDELNPFVAMYDVDTPEYSVIINDWLVELSVNRFANHHHSAGDNKPASMLINGKGMFQKYQDAQNNDVFTPVEVFNVQRGRRYRFRIASNGILNCPIQFSIDDHNLTVIATDGAQVEPIEVESVNVFAGERYDVIVHTNQREGNYWMRVRGEADCGVKKAKQVAIVRYEGASMDNPVGPIAYEDGFRSGRKLNPWNKNGNGELIPVSHLESKLDDDLAFKEIPDKKFYLAMDFNKIDNFRFHDPSYYPISALSTKHLYSPQINHISLILPPSPVLSQFDDLPEDIFCNSETLKSKNCSEEFCECVHLLKVGLGDTVELVVIDEGVTFNANHPMHLHGHYFRVIGMERLNESTSIEEVKRMDEKGLLKRNFTRRAAKDTVTVPDGGYTIMRIHATNPGFWFFHCHIEFHAEIGMGLILQVGEKHEHPKVPKHFPKCGPWQFTGYEDGNTDGGSKTCTNSAKSLHYQTVVFVIFCIVSILSL